MSIIRFEPLRGFDTIAKRMNHLISDLDKSVNFEYGAFAPKIDIKETEKHLHFTAELPGVAKDDVKITINEENVLVISGSKKREQNTEETKDGKTYLKVERSFGEFNRSFILPENLITDSISAKFEHGVLDISIEKKEPVKPKEVEIAIS